MSQLYALDDSKNKPGVYPVDKIQAKEANSKGWGIFHTFNDFNGARRKENLIKINAWAIDIDDGTKEEQKILIKSAPYKPTKVIESKNGYHVYYYAKDAKLENYEEIVKRLIFTLKGDRCAKDVTRLLRTPGYYHCKDINNKFMVKEVFNSGLVYCEAEMLMAFKPEPVKERVKREFKSDPTVFTDPENWRKLFNVDNIGIGNRNHELARIALWMRDEGFDMYDNMNIIMGVNNMLGDKLSEREVEFIVKTKY